MRFWRFIIPAALASALLLGTGCETSEPKKTAGSLPVQATAPTVTESPEVPDKSQVAAGASQTPPPPSDAVGALVAQADRQYAAGEANYKAGHLDAAKQNFDQAFNILLSSDQDLRENRRLEQEFDKVVEAVHQLELVALKQGDGFTEQRSEPAPIDEANDITFPVDPNVRAKAEAEIKTTKSDLPLMLNDQVAMFINYFSSPRGKGTIERALQRAGRYRPMVSSILQEEGVPQDLIYLAQAESGFQPLALSRAGARGMWQFMAGRGSMYGLERNWWIDERQDPEKSTRAAARHLKDLYNEFGDWYLAMAAYNTGPGNIQHAVERTGYADFWELYRRGVLPNETRNYVPIILAVTIMAKNPAQYGLESVVPETPLKADKVTINYPVDLRLVAECLDTSVSYLQELNPSLLRLTTPKDQSFDLNLPIGSKDKYETAIALIPPDMRTWWRYHRVEYGESLSGIAHKYHTSAGMIAEANNLSSEDVKVGSKLIIPIAPGKGGENIAYSKKPTRYKVRKGDTLGSIADDFEVPVSMLRKWNHVHGAAVPVGRTLLIYKAVGAGPGPDVASHDDGDAPPHSKTALGKTNVKSGPPSAAKTATVEYHKVKKGETLSSIAESYNTTVAALKKNNARLTANLRAGDVLLIRK